MPGRHEPFRRGGSLPGPLFKVVLLGPAPPDRGGIAHETARLALELSKRTAVDYFTFSRPYPRWLDPRRYGPDPKLPASPAIPMLDFLSPRSWDRVAAAVARSGAGALLVPWWTSFWAIPVRAVFRKLAAASPETPRVLLCHNIEDHEGGSLKRFLRFGAFASASAFVVHSEEDARSLARIFPGRPAAAIPLPVTEPTGVPRDAALRKLGIEGPLLLFLGLVRPYKGVDLLLDAAPEILREWSGRIAIVGEVFPGSRDLRHRWEKSPVRDRILWKDEYLPEDEMGLWLAACDAVVLPYRKVSASAIAARAIGARRPIAASAVGGLRETVQPGVTGELFEPGDAAGLAAAVRRIFGRGRESYASGLDAAARRDSLRSYADAILSFLEGAPLSKR